jgi:uncharacterized protein (TIGR03083 family)
VRLIGTDLGWHYCQARLRLDRLLRASDPGVWHTPVAACPGWTVHDVMAHLLGNVEDGAAGRISGIPSPALTSEQVERHGDDDPLALLDAWAAAGPTIEAIITSANLWPAAIDVVTHEHDIRAAIERPGARENESVVLFATRLRDGLRTSRPVTIELEDTDEGDETDAKATITLRTTSFDFFRLRMGRRSRDQVLALDWSGNPEPIVDELFTFGPSPVALVE